MKVNMRLSTLAGFDPHGRPPLPLAPCGRLSPPTRASIPILSSQLMGTLGNISSTRSVRYREHMWRKPISWQEWKTEVEP